MLDIGTADGLMLGTVKDAFPEARLVGLESDLALASTAKSQGYDVVRCRAERLPFRGAEFDVITLISTSWWACISVT